MKIKSTGRFVSAESSAVYALKAFIKITYIENNFESHFSSFRLYLIFFLAGLGDKCRLRIMHSFYFVKFHTL